MCPEGLGICAASEVFPGLSYLHAVSSLLLAGYTSSLLFDVFSYCSIRPRTGPILWIPALQDLSALRHTRFTGSLGMFIIYTPPLHVVFGGSYLLSPLYWLIPMAFGVLLLAWASIRVLLLRKGIEQARVKDIKGLMMFPTMRTMSMHSRH